MSSTVFFSSLYVGFCTEVQVLDVFILGVYTLILHLTLFYFRSLYILLIRESLSQQTNSYSVNTPIFPSRFSSNYTRKYSRNFSTTVCLNAKRKRSSDADDLDEFDPDELGHNNKKPKLDFEKDIETKSENGSVSINSPQYLDKGKGKEVEALSSPTNSDNKSDMHLDKGKGKEIAEPNENTNADQSQ